MKIYLIIKYLFLVMFIKLYDFIKSILYLYKYNKKYIIYEIFECI